MQCMKKLIIDNNKLKILNLTNMPKLEYISCVENSINEFFGLVSLQHLQQLYADGNDITEIPSLAHIVMLSIEHNRLSFLPHFPSIQVLNCSYNCLSGISKLSANIIELIVCHNILTSLPCGMKKLEVLDISYNKIVKLDFLTSCSSLKIVNASFNEFENPQIVLQKIITCPITEIDLTGMLFTEDDAANFVTALPLLEKLNMNIIRADERKRLIDYKKSCEKSKSQDIEQKKDDCYRKTNRKKEKSLCLDIPDGEFLSKFSPNSSGIYTEKNNKNLLNSSVISVEFALSQTEENKKSLQIKELEKPKTLSLTPSKTDIYSYVPSKNTSNVFKNNNEVLKESLYLAKETNVPENMKEIYKNIMQSMKKSISKKLLEIAQPNEKKKHHHCNRHKKNRNETKSMQTEEFLSPIGMRQQNFSIRSPNLSIQAPFSGQTSQDLIFEKEPLFLRARSNRNHTPINLMNSPQLSDDGTESTVILKYASMPPRPILLKEENKAIIANLNPNSQEFAMVASLFMENNLKVNAIQKSFTLSLHKGQTFKDLMYFYGEDTELQAILCNPKGFTINEVILQRRIVNDFNYVLVCLSNLSELKQVYKDTYEACNKKAAVPVYLVSYSNFT